MKLVSVQISQICLWFMVFKKVHGCMVAVHNIIDGCSIRIQMLQFRILTQSSKLHYCNCNKHISSINAQLLFLYFIYIIYNSVFRV